jgi:hypothetical protein
MPSGAPVGNNAAEAAGVSKFIEAAAQTSTAAQMPPREIVTRQSEVLTARPGADTRTPNIGLNPI